MSSPSGPGRRDLGDRADVTRMVESFYLRCFADELLGPVFNDVARLDLSVHLPIMCDFWETVLFRTGAYRRNAFTVHADLHDRRELDPGGLTGPMFERWLAIWCANVDDLFAGPAAERAKLQAGRIAASIHRRLAGRPRPSDAEPGAELAATAPASP